MTGVSIPLIFAGAAVFGFSLIMKINGKKTTADFKEALRNFEESKKKLEEKEEKETAFNKEFSKDETAEYGGSNEDDDDFLELMKQAKYFLRLAGAALIIMGVISFFF